jgi:hypothetical protein
VGSGGLLKAISDQQTAISRQLSAISQKPSVMGTELLGNIEESAHSHIISANYDCKNPIHTLIAGH